jgi:hypothetical protein
MPKIDNISNNVHIPHQSSYLLSGRGAVLQTVAYRLPCCGNERDTQLGLTALPCIFVCEDDRGLCDDQTRISQCQMYNNTAVTVSMLGISIR